MSSVVLPLPKKPVRTVTGVLPVILLWLWFERERVDEHFVGRVDRLLIPMLMFLRTSELVFGTREKYVCRRTDPRQSTTDSSLDDTVTK